MTRIRRIKRRARIAWNAWLHNPRASASRRTLPDRELAMDLQSKAHQEQTILAAQMDATAQQMVAELPATLAHHFQQTARQSGGTRALLDLRINPDFRKLPFDYPARVTVRKLDDLIMQSRRIDSQLVNRVRAISYKKLDKIITLSVRRACMAVGVLDKDSRKKIENYLLRTETGVFRRAQREGTFTRDEYEETKEDQLSHIKKIIGLKTTLFWIRYTKFFHESFDEVIKK